MASVSGVSDESAFVITTFNLTRRGGVSKIVPFFLRLGQMFLGMGSSRRAAW